MLALRGAQCLICGTLTYSIKSCVQSSHSLVHHTRPHPSFLGTVGANTDSFTMTRILPVRAFENGLHVLYANHPRSACGCGQSACFSPSGQLLGEAAPPDGEADVSCSVRPLDAPFVAIRHRNPFFAVRQPELYAELAKST